MERESVRKETKAESQAVRIDIHLYNRLKEMSDREYRSVPKTIQMLIEEALAYREQANKA